MKKHEDQDWDEDEDVGTRGPEPERLNSDLSPEELARQVMRAGHPKNVTQRHGKKDRRKG